jgi:hypothetical protein
MLPAACLTNGGSCAVDERNFVYEHGAEVNQHDCYGSMPAEIIRLNSIGGAIQVS